MKESEVRDIIEETEISVFTTMRDAMHHSRMTDELQLLRAIYRVQAAQLRVAVEGVEHECDETSATRVVK